MRGLGLRPVLGLRLGLVLASARARAKTSTRARHYVAETNNKKSIEILGLATICTSQGL